MLLLMGSGPLWAPWDGVRTCKDLVAFPAPRCQQKGITGIPSSRSPFVASRRSRGLSPWGCVLTAAATASRTWPALWLP